MARITTTIDNGLVAYFKNATGLTYVIWDRQEGARPALPYGMISLVSSTREHGATPSMKRTGTDTYQYQWPVLVTVQIDIYTNSDDHMEYIEKAKEYAYTEAGRLALANAGLSYRLHEDTVDNSVLLDTRYEYRASCDFQFGYIKTKTETITEIRRISGTVLGIPFDETVTP